MRRAYVVVGEREGKLDVLYAVCHSMSRADELAYEAEDQDPSHDRIYTSLAHGKYCINFEVIEEDD